MKKALLCILAMLSMTVAMAQSPLNGTYYNKELNMRMKLHIDASDIPVPGLELDSCYGYIQGNINSMWVILKVKKNEGNKAVIRAMCEKGDNAQDLEIELKDDQLVMKQLDEFRVKLCHL